MIATSHVIIGGAVGVAVGTITKNPALALSAGILSHFICDSIPHLDSPPRTQIVGKEVIWDKSLYTFAIIDSLAALAAVLIIWYFRYHFSFVSMFAWGAGGGYLPDLVDNFPLWSRKIHQLPFFKQFHEFHFWIHKNWQNRFPMPKYKTLGIATQLVIGLPCLWYIVK